MPDEPEDEREQIGFRGGWKGLYLFIFVYGLIQIVLLYLFTRTFNQP